MNRESSPASRSAATGEHVVAVVVVGICTAVSLMLRSHLNPTNLVMIYFVGILFVATRYRRNVAIAASAMSVAAIDFFCVPPYYTFVVAHSEYLMTFAVMFAVAVLTSAMTARIRQQRLSAIEREAQTTALYRLSNELAGHNRSFDIAKAAAAMAEQTFPFRVSIFMSVEPDMISFSRRTSDHLFVPMAEQPIAQWVYQNGVAAGRGTSKHPRATALYLPVKSGSRTYAVMAVVAEIAKAHAGGPSAEQQRLLEVFASQTAAAMEKASVARAAQVAELRVETESMRTSLLSAISHDLRTPLAAITGAAATLRTHWDHVDDETRNELLESISDEAERLNRLLTNLLEVTRLESGVHLHKEAFPLEEVIGAALHRLQRRLSQRRVRTDIPRTLPLVAIDDVLMEQVFINLIENAVKYTPLGTDIEVAAAEDGGIIHVEVRDAGPGFRPGDEDLVFDKFFRGRSDNIPGAGLGLAICRAIVEAHGGSIRAQNRAGGGAIIHFSIPAAETAPVGAPGRGGPA